MTSIGKVKKRLKEIMELNQKQIDMMEEMVLYIPEKSKQGMRWYLYVVRQIQHKNNFLESAVSLFGEIWHGKEFTGLAKEFMLAYLYDIIQINSTRLAK